MFIKTVLVWWLKSVHFFFSNLVYFFRQITFLLIFTGIITVIDCKHGLLVSKKGCYIFRVFYSMYVSSTAVLIFINTNKSGNFICVREKSLYAAGSYLPQQIFYAPVELCIYVFIFYKDLLARIYFWTAQKMSWKITQGRFKPQ